jgi:hypothetical protein
VSRGFVDSSGNPFSESVANTLSDQIVYQTKAGTPGSSPVEPTADAGWMPIAYVLVPSTATSSANFTITMAPEFGGFLTSSTSNTYSSDQTITPNCTATSGGGCSSSGGWGLQNSLWNGSAAVTNTWKDFADSSGNLDLRYNNSTEFSLDPSGDATFYGNIVGNASPLTLCGNSACSQPFTFSAAGNLTVPNNLIVDANATISGLTVTNAIAAGSISSSGTVSGNHVTSGDLSASSPTCTNGSSNITTSGCGVPVTAGALGNSKVLCSDATTAGSINTCAGGNWPSAGTATCNSSNACDVVPNGSSWTAGSSCAAGAICAACDLATACGGSVGTPAGCFVRDEPQTVSDAGLIAYINRIGTSPTHTWIVWFNTTGGALSSANTNVFQGEFTCVGGN